MRRRFAGAFCGVFIALSCGPLAAQSPAAPQVGQIVDTEPFYNSEKIWGTGLCDDASTACTYLFYESGPEVVILLGATAKTNADGGVIAIRVTEAARLQIGRRVRSRRARAASLLRQSGRDGDHRLLCRRQENPPRGRTQTAEDQLLDAVIRISAGALRRASARQPLAPQAVLRALSATTRRNV